MRIKRYVCPDVRQAIREIRRDLGPDAVILSNRKLTDGVEISAAVDYDEAWAESPGGVESDYELTPLSPSPDRNARRVAESLEPLIQGPEAAAESRGTDFEFAGPVSARTLVDVSREISTLRGLVESQLSGLAFGDLARRYPARASAFQQLMQLGVTEQIARAVCERIDPAIADAKAAWRRSLGLIAHDVKGFEPDLLTDGGVFALLGPTGVGKTTTVAKLAARFALRHGASEVALITTDTYRIGAHEQLSAFAQIMGVPVRVAHDPQDLRSALVHYKDKKLVLIDTAGISQRDVRFAEQAALIRSGSATASCLLALPATTQYRGLEETVHAFDGAAFAGCVITKMDEAVSLGPVLSIICRHELAAAFLTNGQRVPEDISSCRAHLLVTRAVTLAQEARRSEDFWTEATYGGSPAYASQ